MTQEKIKNKRVICIVIFCVVVAIFSVLFVAERKRSHAFDWVPQAKESELIYCIKMGGTPEEVRTLLKNKPGLINERVPANNMGPIFYAVGTGNTEIVEILLKHGADVNEFIEKIDYKSSNIPVINMKGYSPIHDAVKQGDCEMVKFLVERGADYKRLFISETPLDLAQQYNHPEIAEYLKSLP